ncbi:MAG: hypothetical protein KF768_02545 [Phycisphaeraceae bacterium]|nr:hypothetical protein [Phycisphaeraceae bacterium]
MRMRTSDVPERSLDKRAALAENHRMNDTRIHQLLAKAGELDAFEADLFPPETKSSRSADSSFGLRLVGTHARASEPMKERTHRRWRSAMPVVLGLTGIAAALGLAIVTMRPAAPVPTDLKPVNLAKELPPFIVEFLKSVEAANQRTERDVLLAIYEPADPTQSPVVLDACLQVWTPSWSPERQVAHAGVADLVSESLDHSCLERPGRVTIVGLTGPSDRLPQTQSQAMDLVSCMIDRSTDPINQCGHDDLRLSSAAAQCLPDTVSVRVQTMSFGR